MYLTKGSELRHFLRICHNAMIYRILKSNFKIGRNLVETEKKIYNKYKIV